MLIGSMKLGFITVKITTSAARKMQRPEAHQAAVRR